jgi:hypothetical protein
MQTVHCEVGHVILCAYVRIAIVVVRTVYLDKAYRKLLYFNDSGGI